MKDRRTTVLVVAATLLLVGTAPYAQPTKEQYELQERCGKRAAEVFKREYRPGLKGEQLNYENHYSARLNKCFFLLEIGDAYEKGKSVSRKNMR